MDNTDSDKNEEATQLSGPSQIPPTIITNNNNDSNQLINNPSTSSTYAQATISEPEYIFPSDDNAIIIETIDASEIREYLLSLCKLIPKEKIVAASRISRNRISIYLKDEKTANDLVHENPHIIVNNRQLTIRKLITNTKRITISDVPPSVSNDQLKQEFLKNKLEIVSPIIILKSMFRDEEFSHIFSFRRQTTIKPIENGMEIPDSIVINRGVHPHRIFLSRDDERCSQCLSFGHKAEKCKKNTPNPIVPIITHTQKTIIYEPTINRKRIADKSISESSIDSTIEKMDEVAQHPTLNTPLLETNQSSCQPNTAEASRPRTIRNKRKKKKSIPIEDQLDPLKPIMEQHKKKFVMNYDELRNYIISTKGKTTQEIKDQLTDEKFKPKDLTKTLNDLYHHLKKGSIKARFTKITNILRGDSKNNSSVQPTSEEDSNQEDSSEEEEESDMQ